MMDVTFRIGEIHQVARQLLEWVKHQHNSISPEMDRPFALSLSGAMGSGKTTLIRAMGSHLGCNPLPTSPTFGLVQHYLTKDGREVVHADLYRIRDASEWLALDPVMLCSNAEWLWIEWPERAAAYMPFGLAQFELRIGNSDESAIDSDDYRRLIFRGWVR